MSDTAFVRQWLTEVEGDTRAQGALSQSGVFERLARIGRHLFDVDVSLALLPADQHWIRELDDILVKHGNMFLNQFGGHQALLVPDANACPALKASTLVSKDPGIRFIVWANVIALPNGMPLSIVLADREPHTWTEDRAQLFGTYLEMSCDLLRGELAGQELPQLTDENRLLRKVATVDQLTGLWNRESILDILDREMDRCVRQGLPVSAIVADLDHFKKINDSLGHRAGDAVLEEVGRRLKRAVRRYDAVGRIGGEEFLIVMSDSNEATAAAVAERVHDTIRNQSIRAGGAEVSVTISQGVVTHSSAEKISPTLLFEKADRALYSAKSAGRDSVQQFSEVPGED